MANGRGSLVEAWYRGAWWLWLLRPLEWIFRALSSARRWAYRSGLWQTYNASRPVVVVGNITVGGTGKTPIVIALVESLQRAGLHPGVVSRGYGAERSDFPYRVGPDSLASDCGDEPLLIFRRTGCPCVVDPDRSAAVARLLDDEAIDIVISDDGLQHYALARDLEIAVIDAAAGLGNGFCLPAGPLREAPSRLGDVDFILYRGSADAASGVSYTASALVNINSGESRAFSPDSLGAAVLALAGIGQPEQFFDMLIRQGFTPQTHSYPDHHCFTREDLAAFSSRPVIMTEKDAVKCLGLVGDNAWYLRIDAQLPAPLLSAVKTLARRPG